MTKVDPKARRRGLRWLSGIRGRLLDYQRGLKDYSERERVEARAEWEQLKFKLSVEGGGEHRGIDEEEEVELTGEWGDY